MTFQIRWRQAALDDLASAWMNADPQQRRVITRAAHLVELDLKVDPEGESESRPGGLRIFFRRPLAVVFEIDEPNGRVVIEQVRVFRTH